MKTNLIEAIKNQINVNKIEGVLIADDDEMIVEYLRDFVSSFCDNIVAAKDGYEALEMIQKFPLGLVLLDIMMPRMDGFEVLERLRQYSIIPVIILSARLNTEDKVKGLLLGADDYITKPFEPDELRARIYSVLRRNNISSFSQEDSSCCVGNFRLNLNTGKVFISGREIVLTRTEYSLLYELVINKNNVLTYEYLLDKVWGSDYGDEREYLHVYTNRLRAKLGSPDMNAFDILTVHGTGYCFRTRE